MSEFNEMNEIIVRELKEKGFRFGPIGSIRTESGMDRKEYRVAKNKKGFIITIQEVAYREID